MKNIRMHHPPHPGEILRELCLEPLNLSVTDAAASLDVSRNTLSAMQMQYDLWHAEQSRKRLRVRKFAAA